VFSEVVKHNTTFTLKIEGLYLNSTPDGYEWSRIIASNRIEGLSIKDSNIELMTEELATAITQTKTLKSFAILNAK